MRARGETPIQSRGHRRGVRRPVEVLSRVETVWRQIRRGLADGTFQAHNIKYEQSAAAKSDLYRDFLPIINSGNVDLLDHDRLINQLVGLERRTARSGKDSIDHAPGGHDDVVNSVAGVITSLVAKRSSYDIAGFFRNEDGTDDDDDMSYQAARRNRFMASGGILR